MNRVYIGLGSNLQEPIEQLKRAVKALRVFPDSDLVRVSSFYHSTPMGVVRQPPFVNAVVAMDTQLDPFDLLYRLQTLENQQGRARLGERWGPRTLDLDILLYGNESIDTPELTIPHVDMRRREWVLYPLQEIAPDLVLPNGEALVDWVADVELNGLAKL